MDTEAVKICPPKTVSFIRDEKLEDIRDAPDTRHQTPSLNAVISSHNNNFTIVRLLLAASVIFYHAHAFIFPYNQPDPVSVFLRGYRPLGELAVEVFFFLSGLFVAQSYAKDPHLLRFVARRFLRIWPGLFVCLVVTATVACAISPGGLARYLVFPGFYDYIIHNALLDLRWPISGVFDGRNYNSLNGSIHTLPFEMKMYVIMAIAGSIGVFARKINIAVFCVFVLLAISLPAGMLLDIDHLLHFDWTRRAMAMFFTGVLFYTFSDWIIIRLWQALILIPCFALSKGSIHLLVFYVIVIWLTLYAGQSPVLGRIIRPKSDLSYGIYIYGWPVQQFVVSALGTKSGIYAFTGIALVVASCFAALSWHFIEYPAIRFGSCLSRKKIMELVSGQRLRRPFAWSLILGIGLSGMFGVFGLVGSIMSRNFHPPVVSMNIRIYDFGPKTGVVGRPVNRQPDGGSALWPNISGDVSADTRVMFDGHSIEPTIERSVVTFAVPTKYLATVGRKTIYLERILADRIERSNEVTLQMIPEK